MILDAKSIAVELLKRLPLPRRWQQQLHPMPSAVAIIRRDIETVTKFLLIQRMKEPYVGKWALIGGKWDFGESLAEAMIREVNEETGLDSVFLGVRRIVNYRMLPRSDQDHGAHFLLFVCELRAHQGEAGERTEGKVSWFTASELTQLNDLRQIIPTDYMILQQCLNIDAAISYVEAEVIASGECSDAVSVARFETLQANATLDSGQE
jgi:8-oxo-dGTP diphosphatase